PDDLKELTSTIKEMLKRSDLVIITGGLGPTFDDITREAISNALEKKLIFKPDLAKMIEEKLKLFKHRTNKMVMKQAYVPEGARVFNPTIGTAPGLLIKENGKLLVAFPGVTEEMLLMLEELIGYLKKKEIKAGASKLKILKICGLPETTVEKMINQHFTSSKDVIKSILVKKGTVEIVLFVKDGIEENIEVAEKKLKKIFGNKIFGVEKDRLEEVLGKLLRKKKKTIAFAESCTGGYIGKLMTDIEGSSDYFKGGIIAYSNDLKINILGVSDEVIRKYGAVSHECAVSMAEGVAKKTGADIGVGVTGIAGPKGSSEEKPIGTVFMSLSDKEKTYVKKNIFAGDRETIRKKAALYAINYARLYMLGELNNA
ncbi:MAG: CinA family nicotinamide mononucleotide deamidase-related protein, partial [Actinomycetia bacterium]|nr:CinA family nicotinamide mononucleotide deamidase-related protein [Actinomycetes bacterium]